MKKTRISKPKKVNILRLKKYLKQNGRKEDKSVNSER